MVHFGVYNVGLVIMLPALYLMLQGNTALEPIVAGGSLIVAAAVLLFRVRRFLERERALGV